MTTRNPAGADRRRRGLAGAFTLLEVLIAVGALGLIAVGISQVFRATGETVKAGRRLSAMNTYAALIEKQLREDFSRMTRDGFLLIRNELTQGSVRDRGVLLYHGQPDEQRRHRRVDEIVFFATGDFVSKRPPVHPSAPPVRAQAARVYIGHGLRWHPRFDRYHAPVWLHERLDANPLPVFATSFGYAHHSNPTLRGANEFASDWILMRHHTLLKRPEYGDRAPLTAPSIPGLNAPAKRRDSDFQIGLQPAVRSIFRRFSEVFGQTVTTARFARPNYNGFPSGSKPRFDCGVIDIAATDLTEIRAFLTAVTGVNSGGTNYRVFPTDSDRDIARAFGQFDSNDNPTGWPTIYNTYANEAQSIALIQEWMKNALPVDSDVGTETRFGGRMRVELEPPNPMAYGTRFPTDPLAREFLRADQMMLTSSVFVPGCSEFIVEWSFGDRYGDPGAAAPPIPQLKGELIWHGLERKSPRNGPVTNPNDPRLVTIAQPYSEAATPYKQRYYRPDGTIGERVVREDLIHDDDTLDGTGPGGGRVAYSFFGYTDPTFHGNPAANEPLTVPWPWPRLIRITMSLVDPTDPTFEQTYQFIFELPQDPAEARG